MCSTAAELVGDRLVRSGTDMRKEFGTRLMAAHKAKGYKSARQCALDIDMKISTYNSYELGARYPRNMAELLKICLVLDVSLDYLVFGRVGNLSIKAHKRLQGFDPALAPL